MFSEYTLDTVKRFATKNDTSQSTISELWLNHSDTIHHDKGLILFDNITFILSADQHIRLAENWQHFVTGSMLFTPVNLPFYMDERLNKQLDTPFVAVHLQLNQAILRDVINHIKPHKSTLPQGVQSYPIGPDICDCLSRLLHLLNQDNNTFLANIYKQELYYHLLNSPLCASLQHLTNPHSPLAKIQQICLWIENHLDEPFGVPELAKRCAWGETQFYRYFKQITGMTPVQYQKSLRLNHAKNLMMNEKKSVSEVAYQVGYESVSQFSREYKRHFGVNPKDDKNTA